MGLRVIHLAPDEPQKMPNRASTIALVGGDAPFLYIRQRNGETTRLNIGQCLPIDAEHRLVNPFSRSVKMDVVYNGRVKFDYNTMTDAKNQEIEAVVYHGGVDLEYDGAMLQTPSAYVWQLEGRSIVNIGKGAGSNHKYYLAYGAGPTIISDPMFSAFNSVPVVHSSGDACVRTLVKAGHAPDFAMNTHMGNVAELIGIGFNSNVILPEQGFLFIIGDDTKDLKIAVRVLDLGV